MQHDPPVDSPSHPVDSQLSVPPSPPPSGGSPTLSPLPAASDAALSATEGPGGVEETHGQKENASQEGGGSGERGESTTSSTELGLAGAEKGLTEGAVKSTATTKISADEKNAKEAVVLPEEVQVEGSAAGRGGDEGADVASAGPVAEDKHEDAAAPVVVGGDVAAAPPAIVEPTPSNPAAVKAATDALLASTASLSSTSSSAADADADAAPNGTSSAAAPLAPPIPIVNPSPSVSPAPSTSPAPPATATTTTPHVAAPHPQKKFQSSLAVNKKFLEKAGEKSKPEAKPVATRLATPPIATPVSASHPRLFAGKLSTSAAPSSSITLSTSSSSPSLGLAAGGWKKPASPAPTAVPSSSSGLGAGPSAYGGGTPSLALGGMGGAGAGARGAGGAVWGAKPSMGAGGPGALGLGMGGMGMGPGGGGMGMRGARDMVGEFPTAAEAAHAKEARARAVMEQMQARERAMQARAAAAAAQNAHLLEGLDAFRGVHLDPNAAHWDEDEDDFLDTTIEFADGTQYKIVEDATAPSTPGGDDELREPGPNELALRERPLAPGEVVEPPRREERFSDDFDRSWPRRDGTGAGSAPAHNLFNARLGQFEPAKRLGAGAGGAEPTSILSSRERRTSGGVSDLPPPPHGHHAAGAPSRRRGSFTSPPRGRRPSITSPPTRQVPLPGAGRRESFGEQQQQKAAPAAWGRRPSAELQSGGRQLPPHLAGAGAGVGGAGGRQLPPHLQHQQQHQHQHASPLSPPTRHAPLSPPTQRGGAPLPPLPPSAASALSPTSATGAAAVLSPPLAGAAATTPLAPAPAPAAAPGADAPDLEATHHREMHAAAERAKKRREEEEQARLEQKERARKKAQELEERMKRVEDEKREAEEKQKKADEEAKVAAAVVPPPVAAAPARAPAASEATGSWRQAAKPLAPQAAIAPQATAVPTKILAREGVASSSSAPAAPSSSTAAPAAPPPPTQPSAWRRPLVPATAPTGRAPLHQLPPHMAQQQQAAASSSAPVPAASSAAPAPAAEKALAPPVPVVPAVSPAAPPAKPATPPAPTVALAAPASPSQEKKAAAAKLGYKLPAVSQFDDLMSRIKGVMLAPAETARPAAEAVAPAAEPKEVPTVKLPGAAAPSASSPAAAPTPPNAPPTVSLPVPTEPRGRGRGRTVTPRSQRAVQPPAFEDREPLLPFPSTRLARSHSPPPAWRQYTIRLAPYPPRRPPNVRLLKNFTNVHHPRPVYGFTFEPPMAQINTNRLTRDDWLNPKRYSKGVVQYSVQLPRGRFDERRRAAAAAEAEAAARARKPTVKVSAKQLKRAPAPPVVDKVEPARVGALAVKPEQITFSPFGPEDGDGKTLANGTTWGAPSTAAVPTATLDDVQVAAETAEAVLATETSSSSAAEISPTRTRLPHKKLPEGSSIGFYRLPGATPLEGLESPFPLDRTESAKMFMVTSELNGEKVETTPRKETTAPGAHLSASTGKSPSSPVFRQPDMDGLMSSPSSASAWPTKSLVLNPIVASVWSAPPDENPVHARVASGVKTENSLQGIADDDPSEALPNSLAELKSEDGISTNGDKDSAKRATAKEEAKLRAVAPSFSSFLHEKAASIDTTAATTASEPETAPAASATRPPLPPSFSSFNPQLPPQSSPSPINAYSPAQPYSPQLHPSLQQYGRPLSQQQLYPSYPLASQGVSSFAPHSPYSPQPFAPQSPALQAVGYPSSPYRDPTQPPAPPQHITNPALLANYGYGQPVSAASSPSRNFGAVGAGGPLSIGRPGSGAAFARPPLPTSYISSGYGSPFQAPQGASSPAYRTGEPSYGYSGGVGASHDSSRGAQPPLGGAGGGYSASTMASPVIMPQQPPQVPLFGAGSPVHSHSVSLSHQHGGHSHGLQHGHSSYPIHQQGLPSAVQQAAGIPPYVGTPQPGGGGQGAYGAPGGYGRALPPSRGGTRPPMGAAGFGGRGW
ncbi:hypothetical protein JCM6882_007211 [Rhodosporidiobolus microsporus]